MFTAIRCHWGIFWTAVSYCAITGLHFVEHCVSSHVHHAIPGAKNFKLSHPCIHCISKTQRNIKKIHFFVMVPSNLLFITHGNHLCGPGVQLLHGMTHPAQNVAMNTIVVMTRSVWQLPGVHCRPLMMERWWICKLHHMVTGCVTL